MVLVWRMHGLNDLGLSRNAMSGTLPHWLGGFDALARLRLDENSLSGTLPTWLGSFTQLSELGLHGNRLSGSIPTEIAAASRLSYLYLQDNNYQLTGRISDIPSDSYENCRSSASPTRAAATHAVARRSAERRLTHSS